MENENEKEEIKEEVKEEVKSNRAYAVLAILFIIVLAVFTDYNLSEMPYDEKFTGQSLPGLANLDYIQNDAVTIWGGFQKVLGKKIAYGTNVYKDVTLLKNGYSTLADMNRIYEPAVECALEAKTIADNIGADFIYVQSTGKVRDASDLYKGTIDHSYIKRDLMVETLSSEGINCIDAKKVLEDNLADNSPDNPEAVDDWFDYFYLSDHHWRNNGAFLTYKEICRDLESLGYDMDEKYMDSTLYDKKVYEKIFLGSHGRMAGPLYTGVDDYELWIPQFETDFTLRIPDNDYSISGSFERCFVHYENLMSYSFDYYAYYAYLKQDYKLIEIENNMNPDGPKILIIRDSAAVPVSVFLANQASEIDLFDLRYLEPEESILDYIDEKKPDVIMYMFNTGYLGNYDALEIR